MNELIDTRHFMNIFQIISDSCVIKRERVARLKKKKKKGSGITGTGLFW